jgi:outer membrane immunogenic protein
MKKMLLALAAAAAFTGSAYAADLPARMPMKAAPLPVPVASWTGCYIGGGGGYGLWNQENTAYIDPPLVATRTRFSDTITSGGRGWFGTVQGGCDYQFGLGAHQFVIGAFADGDWGNIHGRVSPPGIIGGFLAGDEKMSSAWAVGGRVGWVVFPQLMTYFTGGYTEATFDRTNFNLNFPPFTTTPVYVDQHTYHGWFLGAGDEYAVGFLPGLFWKTEYRVSEFNTRTNPFLLSPGALATGFSEDSHKWVQTVRSELVYRFNWGGPLVAKY